MLTVIQRRMFYESYDSSFPYLTLSLVFFLSLYFSSYTRACSLELQFYFDAMDQNGLYGPLDNSKMNKQASKVAQTMFVDFIKTGQSECLKQYKNNTRSFCEITPEGKTQVIENYSKEAMDLWDNWMSTAPNGWPSWGNKNEYNNEPIVSWLLNQVLITELIMLGEDVKRMVVYGVLFLYLIWKCTCRCCGCCTTTTKENKND